MPSKQDQPGFWPTALGGFILGVLTVLIVLFLAKRTGNDEPPRPSPPAGLAAPQ